jgi:uncharacterized DUF497 family protein
MHTERRRSPEDVDVIRIISARQSTRAERAAYEEGNR